MILKVIQLLEYQLKLEVIQLILQLQIVQIIHQHNQLIGQLQEMKLVIQYLHQLVRQILKVN